METSNTVNKETPSRSQLCNFDEDMSMSSNQETISRSESYNQIWIGPKDDKNATEVSIHQLLDSLNVYKIEVSEFLRDKSKSSAQSKWCKLRKPLSVGSNLDLLGSEDF